MINSNNNNRYLHFGGGKSQIYNLLQIHNVTVVINKILMINTKLRLLVRDASIAAFLCFGLMFSSCGNTLPTEDTTIPSQIDTPRGTSGESQDSTGNHDIGGWGDGDSGDLTITSTPDDSTDVDITIDPNDWEDTDSVDFNFG